jgi:hypothetical protein
MRLCPVSQANVCTIIGAQDVDYSNFISTFTVFRIKTFPQSPRGLVLLLMVILFFLFFDTG